MKQMKLISLFSGTGGLDRGFENAGFKIDVCQDMTIDWSKFTRDRYSNFLERKNEFIDLHGKDLFDQMKYFYMKIVEYFNVKAIGGLRLICSK